jgi:hypothetical protein
VRIESNMGEGQVPKKVKHGILSSAFSAAGNDIRCFGRAAVSAGIVDGKGRYAS